MTGPPGSGFIDTPVSLTLTANQEGGPGKTVTVSFSNASGVAPSIPEPSTWVMMALGFGALGYGGFRRRNANIVARFSHNSQSLVERLRNAASWPPFYFCRLRFVTPSRVWRFGSACHCAAFRMPSKNATGPTISWPSQWAEHISDWANTGDPTAVERCPPASTRRMPTSCRGRVRMFADLRRVVRRGDPTSCISNPGRGSCRISPFRGPHAPGIRRRNTRELDHVAATSVANVRAQMPQPRPPLEAPQSRAAGSNLGRKTRIQLSFIA